MVLIIPLIAGLFALSGAGTLLWYYALPDDKKQKYDEAVMSTFKQKMQERGIPISFSDTKESIEAKARKLGISEETLKRLINESKEEGKDWI